MDNSRRAKRLHSSMFVSTLCLDNFSLKEDGCNSVVFYIEEFYHL